ncbi:MULTISPECIES: dephospho-CoA kinase [unclassified Leisingera]|uniref:dephospho-CoA kinase n=1 Tax=unclassified Leisingera TaxID=2614906 RepID=UPI0002F728E5|nr:MULTISPECIES: dephospho-CoA kinase [unclassified Leisingera]KIC24358.1 dephospho-CoA kinase [Leisingera sp. ANG-S3]KIC53074.1 dephospho-CoA kinase [Leisingera sp. ANG-S]KID10026.1 dephospho-CoA kinase [Leisingera sp. ANG1]
MSFSLGLTGSIGMGKSTTAKLFAAQGCAVWDADAAVHRLYGRGGAAVAPMGAAFPEAIEDGAVSRIALKQIIGQSPDALKRIESIVHPLVAQDRAAFRAQAISDVLVFDIPLLFETGGDAEMDAVACVTVDAGTQQKRVLARGTMTVEQFRHILQKQMPIEEKKARADYVIETDTLDHAEAQVAEVLADIRSKLGHA